MLKLISTPPAFDLSDYAPPFAIITLVILGAFIVAPEATSHWFTEILSRLSIFFSSQAA